MSQCGTNFAIIKMNDLYTHLIAFEGKNHPFFTMRRDLEAFTSSRNIALMNFSSKFAMKRLKVNILRRISSRFAETWLWG